jgi:hypothetical protein
LEISGIGADLLEEFRQDSHFGATYIAQTSTGVSIKRRKGDLVKVNNP